MNLIKTVTFCSVLGSAFSIAAQVPATWSYQDCIDYARLHNIQLQQSALNEQVSDYSVEEAKAQWLPTLDFGTSHSYSNSPWGTNTNSLNGNFNLNAGWTVYNGGRRSNNIKLSETQREIDRLATTDLFRSIKTDLLTVYLNILYARESIDIYEETVQLSEAQALRAQGLMEAGKLSRVDYAQLKAQLEQDNYSLVNARSQYATRTLELKKILQLGISDSISAAPLDWPEAQVLADLPPIAESYAMALDTDIQLKSLALQDDAADLDIAIAKAGRLPVISLNAGVGTGYAVPGENFGTQLKKGWGEQLGISLQLPILDQKKTKVAVAKAQLAKQGVALDTDQRLLDLQQAVESWYVTTREAQSRYVAAVEQEKAAALSNELINERFTLGLVNPVELLTAHNTLLEARHSVLQAKYMALLGEKMIEYYRTAEISLP
ncbi:MAG: TolC family protein [Muribaculaceae bacterium]|nr:TolC family protein [Muribaculaceae bacterium]MDE7080726.1 TolC family protein [Muribaculaceae bacterium]